MGSELQIEPVRDAVHLCIDMQRVFAKGGLWETPWMERVLPTIVRLTERYAERTIFTRFITPQKPEDRPGRWQKYFTHWELATRSHLGSEQLELLPELRKFVPPARIVDKPAYSAFVQSDLYRLLIEKHVRALVVTGAETDVCVLSTVLSAVDLGFRVILVESALCSSSDAGHEALMTMYRTRFHQQIELLGVEELWSVWGPSD